MSKNIITGISLMVALAAIIIAISLNDPIVKLRASYDSLVVASKSHDLDLIRADLDSNYVLSASVKDEIISSIDLTSKEFGIPRMYLHAVFQTESSYRFWIDHPIVRVPVFGKITETRAKGMAGIIWLFWKDSLIAKGIVEVESDLYIPSKSIRSCGYILRYFINESKDSKDIISSVSTRYLGAYSKLYESKMKEATSRLWMKQVEREMRK